jgi:Leucine-rich repeat (LRR) protein
MKITVGENTEYDTGDHSEVTEIFFKRHVAGNFFKDNRFPNLVNLDCSHNALKKLELNCPSLQKLECQYNRLTKLELICPSLQELWCGCNYLTELNCSSLQKLRCDCNNLT